MSFPPDLYRYHDERTLCAVAECFGMNVVAMDDSSKSKAVTPQEEDSLKMDTALSASDSTAQHLIVEGTTKSDTLTSHEGDANTIIVPNEITVALIDHNNNNSSEPALPSPTRMRMVVPSSETSPRSNSISACATKKKDKEHSTSYPWDEQSINDGCSQDDDQVDKVQEKIWKTKQSREEDSTDDEESSSSSWPCCCSTTLGSSTTTTELSHDTAPQELREAWKEVFSNHHHHHGILFPHALEQETSRIRQRVRKLRQGRQQQHTKPPKEVQHKETSGMLLAGRVAALVAEASILPGQ